MLSVIALRAQSLFATPKTVCGAEKKNQANLK
jgi:hypothetical protein